MFNFEWKWWEKILLFLWFVVANILAFPCFILQKVGIKAKKYASWLNRIGADQLTLFDIFVFNEK